MNRSNRPDFIEDNDEYEELLQYLEKKYQLFINAKSANANQPG